MTEEPTETQRGYARCMAVWAEHEAAKARHAAEEAAAARSILRWFALTIFLIAAPVLAAVIHGHQLGLPELEEANAVLRAKVDDLEQHNTALREAVEDYKAGLAGCQARRLWEVPPQPGRKREEAAE